ncbi:hypothetical protein [Mycobacterium timonense]|uniref:DUF4355 domain-containing protein n=1 Tax=Mycobacterium timonense TaxID=701043 RepID=A0ABX3TNW2_9MYCO|nr:hypothetical protein [Mycobacterium timonense]ORB80463.1 hypothetical protein BST46_08625 [Mycobacterium timonense]
MTEQARTPENGPQLDGDGQPTEAEGIDTEAPKGTKEARFRQERNEARAERDSLAERVAQLQTRELERIASKSLSNPADLLTLSGKSLADFLDENGELDAELVTETANELLGTRPGLRPHARPVDPSQGTGNARPTKAQPTFADLLKS